MASPKHYPIPPCVCLATYIFCLQLLQAFVEEVLTELHSETGFVAGPWDYIWCLAKSNFAWSFTVWNHCLRLQYISPWVAAVFVVWLFLVFMAASASIYRQMWCHPCLYGKWVPPKPRYLITLKSGGAGVLILETFLVPNILGYMILFTIKVIILKPKITEMHVNCWLIKYMAMPCHSEMISFISPG